MVLRDTRGDGPAPGAGGLRRPGGVVHPEVASFPNGTGLAEFLETVCLHEHLATMAPAERSPFAAAVAAALPAPAIDYVRLNIVARAR